MGLAWMHKSHLIIEAKFLFGGRSIRTWVRNATNDWQRKKRKSVKIPKKKTRPKDKRSVRTWSWCLWMCVLLDTASGYSFLLRKKNMSDKTSFLQPSSVRRSVISVWLSKCCSFAFRFTKKIEALCNTISMLLNRCTLNECMKQLWTLGCINCNFGYSVFRMFAVASAAKLYAFINNIINIKLKWNYGPWLCRLERIYISEREQQKIVAHSLRYYMQFLNSDCSLSMLSLVTCIPIHRIALCGCFLLTRDKWKVQHHVQTHYESLTEHDQMKCEDERGKKIN